MTSLRKKAAHVVVTMFGLLCVLLGGTLAWFFMYFIPIQNSATKLAYIATLCLIFSIAIFRFLPFTNIWTILDGPRIRLQDWLEIKFQQRENLRQVKERPTA